MAEINDNNGIKNIAFYLPQFHTIPENDYAWGKGFTEWTNTKKAKPMFEGHYQPKVPLNENYYCLLDDDVKIWQAELAKKYNVFGFCYYHYWFKNGKKLLEKPAEQMLKNPSIDIPFCFSWANENWSKRWDGGNHELIAEQDYGTEADWKIHLEYLIPFFKDKRYITMDGNPVFLIYKPEEIPNVEKMLAYWRREIRNYGFENICFMIQNPKWYFSPSYDMGTFDFQIKFQPFFALAYNGKNMSDVYRRREMYRLAKRFHAQWIIDKLFPLIKKLRHHNIDGELRKLDYDEMWETIIASETDPKYVEGAFVDWDNTARKKNGYVHIGASPDKFMSYMKRLYEKVNHSSEPKIVFINAWNEWCEGAYLEPDEAHEYAYLERLKKATTEMGI